MESLLTDAWYRSKKWIYILWPLTCIYRLIIWLCSFFYRIGLKKTVALDVPVIVVGNLTVGGTGKTPLIIYLTNLLSESGYQVGIVSRGYKGTYKEAAKQVKKDSSAEEVGDEPILLARRLDCPVVVARNRVDGALLLQNELGCNLVLSDDGLQHYALRRDMEILVVDGDRGFGNGLCLPAGPLREPLSRAASVDFCIVNGEAKTTLPSFLSDKKSFSMRLSPQKWRNLSDQSLSFQPMPQVKFHAVTGIGNPNRFFNLLKEFHMEVQTKAFPDHYSFKEEDFILDENVWILMTEKDAVKCFNFADKRYWYLPVEASLDFEFKRLFLLGLGGIVEGQVGRIL